MTYCFNCNKDVSGDEKISCKERKHDLDSERLYGSERISKKPTAKSKAETASTSDQKKETYLIKRRFGTDFVESILFEGKPAFIGNIDNKIQHSFQFEHDGIIYKPKLTNEYPYEPYDFSKDELDLMRNNPEEFNTEKLLELCEKWVDRYIDTPDTYKTLLIVDLLYSYCQDQIDTVHYLFVVGDTESGKSSIGHLFRWLGYRPLYGEGIPYADVYNFYGFEEEACGTIIEDEAQDISKEISKINLYKNGYSRGSKKPIIVGKDGNNKRQVYYYTYGFKVFCGEAIPKNKGFQERLVVIPMHTGFPKSNIKKPTEEEKTELLQLRKKLLFWKVLNINKKIPRLNSGLKNRDAEFWDDLLGITSDTKYSERVNKMVKFLVDQRHYTIQNSLESRLFGLTMDMLDENREVEFEKFWLELEEEKRIDGKLEKNTFYSDEYGKITKNTISTIWKEKFQGRKIEQTYTKENKSHQKTKYRFGAEIILKLTDKYSYKLDEEHVMYRGQGGQSGKGGQDHLDDLDDFEKAGKGGI